MPPVHYHSGQFPPSDLDWTRLAPLLEPANGAVARYDPVLASVQNSDLLLSPLLNHEAVMSNRIEGSEATLGEVLEFEARGEPDPGSSEKSAENHGGTFELGTVYTATRHIGIVERVALNTRVFNPNR